MKARVVFGGEIALDSAQTCNLSNVNVLAFVNDDGSIDYDGMYRAFELSARVGYRTTCVELELPEWNYKQKRDRLLGVSISGWFDFVDATGITKEEQVKILQTARQKTTESANNYADLLGLNRPLLVTTVKPSGSSSQLFGESAGVHRAHSPFFRRHVRISSNDPLVQVCEELGYKVVPEVGQNEESCDTKVVEFFVKSKAKRNKGDVGAIEQLEDYVMFQENWTQHNTSITIHVREHEWEEVESWVYENWDKVVSISFIPYTDSFYQLMPYEEITEEEYNEAIKRIKPFDQSLLSKYEFRELDDDDLGIDDSCSTGGCAVR